MALLSVDEALQRILDGVTPTDPELVAIEQARGRVLAEPLRALVTQPPFNSSAMDGYAVRAADVADLPAVLTVIGEAAAGHPFASSVGKDQAVRIFTGAPVPEGATAIVIQENAERDGAKVAVREGGIDFFKVSEPLLAFRRAAGDKSLVCLFNLSAEPIRVTVENGAAATLLPLSEGATLARSRLTLEANAFAFFEEAAGGSRLDIKFNRRAKR